MAAPRRTPEEQLKQVTACRASGLTVTEWCEREDIQISTYYTWVERLTKKGMLEKPVAIPQRIIRKPYSPDIVKVEVAAPIVSESTSISNRESDCSLTYATEASSPVFNNDVAMEISYGQVQIKITNQVNPQLLADMIRLLGGNS